jgi:hypothetical protein
MIGVAKWVKIWSNQEMSLIDALPPKSNIALMESVEYWRDLVREQQQVIESEQQQIEALTVKAEGVTTYPIT